MVEQFHGKEEVIGSTPIVSTTLSSYTPYLELLLFGFLLVNLLFILYI